MTHTTTSPQYISSCLSGTSIVSVDNIGDGNTTLATKKPPAENKQARGKEFRPAPHLQVRRATCCLAPLKDHLLAYEGLQSCNLLKVWHFYNYLKSRHHRAPLHHPPACLFHAHTQARTHTHPSSLLHVTRPSLGCLNWPTRTRSSEEKHSSGIRDWWLSCTDSFSLLGDGTNVWKCDSENVSGLTTHVHAYLSCAHKPHRYVVSSLWALAGCFCQLCPQTHSTRRCARRRRRRQAASR